MSKVATPYTSYDELMLDLDIFGTLISQPQPDLAELKEFLYEEYKRVHKVTLESRRYELSDVVSADFHVNYVKDIELLEDEEELSWGTDSDIEMSEPEDDEYADGIYDVPTQEEIQALEDEIVALTAEQQASAEGVYGSVEVGSVENSGMVDMSFDNDLSDDNEVENGSASINEEENYDSGSGFVFAEDLTEDELNVKIDEEEDEEEEDEEEFGVDDDEDFLSSSDTGSFDSESEETVAESTDVNDYESFDAEDEEEEEFGADEEESSEDTEDDEDFDDWSDTDGCSTQEEIQEPEVADAEDEDDEDWGQEPEVADIEDEDDEDWGQEPEPSISQHVTAPEPVQPTRVPERKQPISKTGVSRDIKDIARRKKSEQAQRNKIEKQRQVASIPKSVPPVPIMPPRQEKKVDAEPKINREDEPKDLREFLRKHPHSEVSFVLKYFSKKELQKAIMSGRIIKKGSKLHI